MAYECKLKDVSQVHTAESCCKIIYKKCDKKILEKLQTPLELTFPDIFGSFDKEQEMLIKAGAAPVILVENASEFVSQMKNVHGFIEQIVQYILDDNKKKYVFLGSHTFPAVVKEKWLQKWPSTDSDGIYGRNIELTQRYDEIIRNIKPGKMSKQAILHMAINLGDIGHYGVAIKNDKKLIVFDSMQKDGFSDYTAMFVQIANDVFGIQPQVLMDPTRYTCPQPTGGFVNENPSESEEDYLIRLQDLDSQNHFCYLWAIWYFHIFVVQGEEGIASIFKTLHDKSIPPLAVMKRYIWSVLHSFYPDDKTLTSLITEVVSTAHDREIDAKTADFLTRFFMLNFRYIWDDFGSKNFSLYSIIECDLAKFRGMTNINDCLTYSLESFDYVLERITK